MVDSSSMSRAFIQTSIGAFGVATALGFALQQTEQRTVRVGVVGTGGRGSVRVDVPDFTHGKWKMKKPAFAV